jgi:23S rRNA pseudouridine2605 synthase
MEKNPKNEGTGGEIRLQVWLARSGVGSRRRCDELIAAGRIAVNGDTVTRMGTKVSDSDTVTMDGRALSRESKSVTLAVHKPKGFLCASSDVEGRPLVSDLFRQAVSQRLFHVGRLDFMSTGLILYTNDGELARKIGHPSSGIEREYLVETSDTIDPGFLEEYRRGIWADGTMYRCARYSLKNPRAAVVVLREGKNREIRNVFMSRRLKVKRVHRLRIGILTLRGLPPGHFRHLTERELHWFQTHEVVSAQKPRDARQGPRDTRQGPRDTRQGPRDTRQGPQDTRQGPRDTRQGPRDTRQGPRDTRQGPRDTRQGPRGEKRSGGAPGKKPSGGDRKWK